MCSPTLAITAASMAFQAYSGYQQSQAQIAAGEAQGKYYDYLAEQSRLEGEAALKTGQKQSELVQNVAKAEGKQLKKSQAQLSASQRAAMAASGVDVSSVTAQDIVSSTYSEQKLDELALRYNADIKSWGIKTEAGYKNWAANVQAGQYGYAGKHARYAGRLQARSTLLGTAAKVGTAALFGLKGGFNFKGTNLGPGTTSYGINVPSRYIPPK